MQQINCVQNLTFTFHSNAINGTLVFNNLNRPYTNFFGVGSIRKEKGKKKVKNNIVFIKDKKK